MLKNGRSWNRIELSRRFFHFLKNYVFGGCEALPLHRRYALADLFLRNSISNNFYLKLFWMWYVFSAALSPQVNLLFPFFHWEAYTICDSACRKRITVQRSLTTFLHAFSSVTTFLILKPVYTVCTSFNNTWYLFLSLINLFSREVIVQEYT